MADGAHVLPLATSQDHKRLRGRRSRAQHRRHGRVLACAGGHAGRSRAHHARGHRADHPRAWRPRACRTPGSCTPASWSRPTARPTCWNSTAGSVTRKRSPFSCGCGRTSRSSARRRSTAAWTRSQAAWDPRAALGVVHGGGGVSGGAAHGRGDLRARACREASREDLPCRDAAERRAGGGRAAAGCSAPRAWATTVAAAQRAAYALADAVHWPGAFYRRDIGYRAL